MGVENTKTKKGVSFNERHCIPLVGWHSSSTNIQQMYVKKNKGKGCCVTTTYLFQVNEVL